MSKNDGGLAFPIAIQMGDGTIATHHGMDLRDYFAAQIFAAMIAGGHWPINSTSEEQARMAYKHADAMISERAK
jgi:hypothetical protein